MQTRERFAARLEALHQQSGEAGSVAAWFAEKAQVSPRSVRRWLSGERTPDGPVWALLECLEREMGT